ncbi:Rha family transcriptional regulator [Desulfovibrio sp. SGI.169]|uniref:Rha family transcriptional regulator n=1 Tax=Desulfovibrio sp. SGI.169 TaxID=3420561 RepID=UPI003CFC031B
MSQAQVLPTEHFSPSVSLIEGRPATTSLAIAECFGKRHDDVTKSIRNLHANCPDEFRARNFAETFRTVAGPNNSQRQEKFFTVYFDGFILLVMGYTGKKALAMKLAYIEAFNAMKEQLDKLAEQERARRAAEARELPDVSRLSTPASRKPLRALVHAWAQVSGTPHTALWPQVKAHFQLSRIDDLPESWLPDALEWVQAKIDSLTPALPSTDKESLTVAPAIEPAPEQALAAATLDAKTYASGKQFFDDVSKLRRNAEGIREALHIFARPGGRSAILPHEKQMLYDNANEAANVAVTSLNQAIYALRMIYNIRAHVSFSR